MKDSLTVIHVLTCPIFWKFWQKYLFGFPGKFLGEWQEEFEITKNDFDKPNSENDITNTKIFDVDFNIDIKNEVDLNSIEKGLSNPEFEITENENDFFAKYWTQTSHSISS